jgi:hypothetical protein
MQQVSKERKPNPLDPISTLQQVSGSKLPSYPQKHCKPPWWLYYLQVNSNPFPCYSDEILETQALGYIGFVWMIAILATSVNS